MLDTWMGSGRRRLACERGILRRILPSQRGGRCRRSLGGWRRSLPCCPPVDIEMCVGIEMCERGTCQRDVSREGHVRERLVREKHVRAAHVREKDMRETGIRERGVKETDVREIDV